MPVVHVVCCFTKIIAECKCVNERLKISLNVMCASSLMEFYAIEDYQMSTCLWMSLMSDNEANLFY